MKWIKRKYKLKELKGNTRLVKRFLFFPRTLDFETRWLEYAEIEQSVVKTKDGYKWQSIKYK